MALNSVLENKQLENLYYLKYKGRSTPEEFLEKFE